MNLLLVLLRFDLVARRLKDAGQQVVCLCAQRFQAQFIGLQKGLLEFLSGVSGVFDLNHCFRHGDRTLYLRVL